MLANRRKAYASKGDDATLTRFVKTESFHASKHRTAPMPENATGTRFPGKIVAPRNAGNLLVSGHSNMKLGRDVRKAKLRGYWIYTLSLEERATCPHTCQHWTNCYGNSLHLNKRIDHTDPDFLPTLEKEIVRLCSIRGRAGVLIRLHALGDFYSQEYVQFWRHRLTSRLSENLAIFGYTARHPSSWIGHDIWNLNQEFPERCFIRFSDGGLPAMSTVSIGDETDCPSNAFVCPEQTGKTRCCATCGACWSTTKNVAFMEH